LTDFFCWTFSSSSNLIDLLTTVKQPNGRPKEAEMDKKVDASFYVTTNWRFMKEVYICLQKMVDFFNLRASNFKLFVPLSERSFKALKCIKILDLILFF